MIRFKRKYKFLVGCSFDAEQFLNDCTDGKESEWFFRAIDNATMQIMSPFVSGEKRTHQAQQRME